MPSDAEYEQDRLEAARDIREAGKLAWIIARTRTGGSERSPIYEEVAFPLWVVELHQRLKNIDGSLAPATAHTLLVSTEGLPFPIGREHQFSFGGEPEDESWSVLEPRPLRPGNITILWEVDLGG